MTTIGDIQNGKYCKNCDANCKWFINESDCCLHDTAISRMSVRVGETDLNEEIQYEFVNKSYILIQK